MTYLSVLYASSLHVLPAESPFELAESLAFQTPIADHAPFSIPDRAGPRRSVVWALSGVVLPWFSPLCSSS